MENTEVKEQEKVLKATRYEIDQQLNQYIGNILNDLTQRRGRVLNMEELGDDTQNIIALAPESEILDYVTQLRVLTQGSGFFNREFDSFQEAPNYLIDSIIKNNSLLNK